MSAIPIEEPIGKRYGRLVVAQFVGIKRDVRGRNHAFYRCMCDCGNTVETMLASLRSGNTKSCGCLAKDINRSRTTTHGLSDTKEHRIWRGIKSRIFRPKSASYKHYGGRGISISPEWAEDFTAFLRDVGPIPGPGMSIERLNNDGNYEKSNVIWADRKTQSRNTSRSRIIEFNGSKRTLIEWAEILKISYQSLFARFEYGWSVERALTTPIQIRSPKRTIEKKKRSAEET